MIRGHVFFIKYVDKKLFGKSKTRIAKYLLEPSNRRVALIFDGNLMNLPGFSYYDVAENQKRNLYIN
jgi:hypothetical protein